MNTKQKAVYKLNVNCGRMGNLEGLFIADKTHVRELIDSKIRIYFGEVLGKHSEIVDSINENEIILVSDSPDVIKVIEDFDLENGYNPFHYGILDAENDEEDMTAGEIIEKRLNVVNQL